MLRGKRKKFHKGDVFKGCDLGDLGASFWAAGFIVEYIKKGK